MRKMNRSAANGSPCFTEVRSLMGAVGPWCVLTQLVALSRAERMREMVLMGKLKRLRVASMLYFCTESNAFLMS